MQLPAVYQGVGDLGICSVDCCNASWRQDLWPIPIIPKSAESGCGMWVAPYRCSSISAVDRPHGGGAVANDLQRVVITFLQLYAATPYKNLFPNSSHKRARRP